MKGKKSNKDFFLSKWNGNDIKQLMENMFPFELQKKGSIGYILYMSTNINIYYQIYHCIKHGAHWYGTSKISFRWESLFMLIA